MEQLTNFHIDASNIRNSNTHNCTFTTSQGTTISKNLLEDQIYILIQSINPRLISGMNRDKFGPPRTVSPEYNLWVFGPKCPQISTEEITANEILLDIFGKVIAYERAQGRESPPLQHV